jgi:hypothetical protein
MEQSINYIVAIYDGEMIVTYLNEDTPKLIEPIIV